MNALYVGLNSLKSILTKQHEIYTWFGSLHLEHAKEVQRSLSQVNTFHKKSGLISSLYELNQTILTFPFNTSNEILNKLQKFLDLLLINKN